MAGEIDVPGIGKVPKVWAVAGAGLLLGMVGFAWFRRAGSGPEVTDADLGLDTELEDSVDAYQGAFGTPALTPYGERVDPSTLPPTTNPEWSRRAIEYLTAANYEPVVAATAIGKYLSRVEMTQAEADMVRYAIAVLGQPPTGNFTITVSPTPTVPTPGPNVPDDDDPPPTGNPPPVVNNSWDTWQSQNLATGQVASFSQYDWGMIARRTFGAANPTKDDVFYRSLALHKKYPQLAKQYPFYVPAHVASTITYP